MSTNTRCFVGKAVLCVFGRDSARYTKADLKRVNFNYDMMFASISALRMRPQESWKHFCVRRINAAKTLINDNDLHTPSTAILRPYWRTLKYCFAQSGWLPAARLSATLLNWRSMRTFRNLRSARQRKNFYGRDGRPIRYEEFAQTFFDERCNKESWQLHVTASEKWMARGRFFGMVCSQMQASPRHATY